MAAGIVGPVSAELHCANLLDHILCHEPDSMTFVSGQHHVSFNAPILCSLSPLLADLAKQTLQDKCFSSHDRIYVYLPDLKNWKIINLLKTFLSCGEVDYISNSDVEDLEALIETLGINISTKAQLSTFVRQEDEQEDEEQQFVVAIKCEVEGKTEGAENSCSSTVIKVEKDQYDEIKKLLASAKSISNRNSTKIDDVKEVNGKETTGNDTNGNILTESVQTNLNDVFDKQGKEAHNPDDLEMGELQDSETISGGMKRYTFHSSQDLEGARALPSDVGYSQHTLCKENLKQNRYLPNRKVTENFKGQLSDNTKKIKRIPKSHNNVVHSGELYSCSKCNFKTKNKDSLEKHQRVHGIKYACNQCDYTGTKTNLKQHKKSVHKKSQYPCTQCDYIAAQNQNLRNHIESVHSLVQYPCSQCDYKAKRKATLKQHFDSIHAKIEYFCSQCNYKAKQRSTLKNHVASVHDGVRYPCDKCDFSAKQKATLTRHNHKVHK